MRITILRQFSEGEVEGNINIKMPDGSNIVMNDELGSVSFDFGEGKEGFVVLSDGKPA